MNKRTLLSLSLLLIVSLVALYLSYLSWPRLRSSLTYLPVESAISAHWQGQTIKGDRFQALIETANESVRILDDVRFHRGLSLLHYLYYLHLATAGAAKEVKDDSLRMSQRVTEGALRRAPARPELWLRLASIRSQLGEDARRVLGALTMSMLVAPVEPHLSVNRVQIGLRYANHADAETLSMLRDQVLLAWKMSRVELTARIKSGAIEFREIRALLQAEHYDKLEEMENVIGPAD